MRSVPYFELLSSIKKLFLLDFERIEWMRETDISRTITSALRARPIFAYLMRFIFTTKIILKLR